MGRINVCVACDDNYSRYAAVVIASILANAKDDDDLYFYILDGGISEISRTKMLKLTTIRDCNINFVNIDDSMFSDYMAVKTHGYISLPTFYRLKAASLMPDVDRIIYFDCDVVVNSCLNDLFFADLDGNAVGGVLDIKKRMVKKNPTYVNAGMLVLDLSKIREENIEEEFLIWTREHFDEITVGDQQIINETLKGRIKLLPSKWNVQSSNFTNRSSYEKRPNVIHYVGGQKPWKPASWNYFKWFYRQYEDMTPWAEHRTAKEIKRDDIEGMKGYLKYRPLFFLRPRFYKAVYYTYIRPLK
uniref:glycosyltransferase family 8 protein n=1 Tax=Candidatus Scatousia sp. TaxID=3085663 RepID=UPI0040289AE2